MMMPKIFIRRVLSVLLSFTGIHALLERLYLSDRAFILMYHRIVRDHLPSNVQPGMIVSAAAFEKHVSFLRSRFEIVFLDELMTKVRKGEHIGRCCALTFDDGWRDNYSEAFPVLKQYDVPATIFLTTGYVGTRRTFWPDEVASCLARFGSRSLNSDGAPHAAACFAGEIAGLNLNQKGEEGLYEGAIELLKQKSHHDREVILAYLRSSLVGETPDRQILSWEEAQEMMESGLVRFGAHTVNHELLDQMPLEQASEEISRSRRHIEHRLRQTVTSFAYPNGNHNPAIRRLLAAQGFETAVTTRKGYLEPGISLLEVPRIGLHEDICTTIPMLRSRILIQAF